MNAYLNEWWWELSLFIQLYVSIPHFFAKGICNNFYFLNFVFWDVVSFCPPGWSTVAWSQLTATSASWGQVILLPKTRKELGLYVHAWLIFVFLVEMGFHYVGLTGLQHLTVSDLLASASQSAGIIGVSHRAWPNIVFTYALELLLSFSIFSFSSFLFRDGVSFCHPSWSAVAPGFKPSSYLSLLSGDITMQATF